jgi:hypothetical protein
VNWVTAVKIEHGIHSSTGIIYHTTSEWAPNESLQIEYRSQDQIEFSYTDKMKQGRRESDGQVDLVEEHVREGGREKNQSRIKSSLGKVIWENPRKRSEIACNLRQCTFQEDAAPQTTGRENHEHWNNTRLEICCSLMLILRLSLIIESLRR